MSTLISFNKNRKIGVVYLPQKKIIRKFSLEKKKNKLINNEHEGIKWYYSRCSKKKNKLIKRESDFLDIDIIKGEQIKFWDRLSNNYHLVERVISHYNEIWPKNKFVPCHGDLTFSNIIFKDNGEIRIIDWENYVKNKMYWGYDLAYFLISTVALPSIYHNEKAIINKELDLLLKSWKKVFRDKNYPFLKSPINFLKKNYGKTFLLRSKNNYYPNLLSSFKIKQINEALNNKS